MAHRGPGTVKVFTRAPMRIDWAGGWTDVPQYAERHGGAVVNSAIALYVHVECRMGDRRIRLHAEDVGEHVTIESARFIRYDGTLDLHKAALNMLPVTGGIEILSRSDAPAGSGLGGSGALDVALMAGLARCREEEFSPDELAEMGFLLETAELSLAGGRQDQYAAALGGSHHFGFGSRGVAVQRLGVDADAAADLAAHMVLAYTGRSHFSSQTHDRVWARYAENDPDVTEALATLRELPEQAGGALESGDWRALAEVIDENWTQQQRLDATIATPHTREIEQAARDAGAWGLKATGAGAGGCIVVLGPPDRRAEIAQAVAAHGARMLDVGFALDGVKVRAVADDAPDSD